jgi:hypothetical protein
MYKLVDGTSTIITVELRKENLGLCDERSDHTEISVPASAWSTPTSLNLAELEMQLLSDNLSRHQHATIQYTTV